MDIRNFITFNTVVYCGGFTAAAEYLNYAQSTVSLHIKELEAHYKTPIFDRIGKKIVLTSFGESLYNQSKSITEQYENMLELDPAGQTTEVLRIGVFESLLRYRLYDLIHSFKKSYPHVDLIIHHGVCKELRDMVRKGELDLTFQIEPIRTFNDLKTKTLCQESFKLILPQGESLDYMHKKNQTIYFTEKNCSYRGYFEDYLDEQGIARQQYLQTGSVDMIKQYVGFGLGFSMVPATTVASEENRVGLTCYNIELPPLFVQLVYHKDKFVFPAMGAFLEMVDAFSGEWA